jgi:tetratricopeptide (TPR) repeat protein
MYVDAVRGLYEGYSDTPASVRWQRYITRMAALRRAYPDDNDASMFYALGLVWTAGAGRAGLARRRQALHILLPLYSKLPDHPGAAHYIIHAADTPELARVALPAARGYAGIAPESPHATHMPSHIFSRLGLWPEVIRSNEDSARVAADWVRKGRDGRFDEHHALGYLEYAWLQLNQLEKAKEQVSRIRELMSGPGGEAWAEIDARILYDVSTANWEDALRVQPPPSSPLEENFDVFWVHTLAAARLGQIESARQSVGSLMDSVDRQKAGSGPGAYLHIYLLQAQALLQAAEGKRQGAIKTLKSAIAYEKAHPVDYPTILAPPSSELLGTLLLDMGQTASARRAFRQALTMAPNRWISLEGVKHSEARLRSSIN